MNFILMILIVLLPLQLGADTIAKYQPSESSFIKRTDFIATAIVNDIVMVSNSKNVCINYYLNLGDIEFIKGKTHSTVTSIAFNGKGYVSKGDRVLIFFNKTPRLFKQTCPQEQFSGEYLGGAPYSPLYKITENGVGFYSINCNAEPQFLFEENFSVLTHDECASIEGDYREFSALLKKRLSPVGR